MNLNCSAAPSPVQIMLAPQPSRDHFQNGMNLIFLPLNLSSPAWSHVTGKLFTNVSLYGELVPAAFFIFFLFFIFYGIDYFS